MTTPVQLHYAPDNASLCVRLALEALGRPYDTVLVDRSAQAQRDPRYLALNPNGRIPTLETPNGVLFETAAILLWLADQDAGHLFPAPTAPARGVALTWFMWVTNTLHPCVIRTFYPARYGAEDDVRTFACEELRDLLARLDAHWPAAATDLTTCYLAPLLRWLKLYGENASWFDLNDYPTLHITAEHFESHDFAKRAAAAEGLGPTPFSNPTLPNPPEGSAL